MAKSKNNVVTHGLSGKIGDMLVFSQRKGQTIVGKVPKKRTTPDTASQAAHKKKFQHAVLYAQSVLADPALKKEYKKEAEQNEHGATAYNIALADLLQAPEIEEIDLSQYSGKKGDIISILVTDDFKVKSVTVKIENEDGGLVEEGAAVDKTTHWEYKATASNTEISGDKITIQAFDMPDNMAEKSQEL